MSVICLGRFSLAEAESGTQVAPAGDEPSLSIVCPATIPINCP